MINTLRLYEELSDTLGEASARVLARILGSIYEDLKNTVTKEDFQKLKQGVTELTERRKERKTGHGTRGREKTNLRGRLSLFRRLEETNRQLGGLAMTVGYTLENTAHLSSFAPKRRPGYPVQLASLTGITSEISRAEK